MINWVPSLWNTGCPVKDGTFNFLTEKEIQIWDTARELKSWIEAWFDMLDFSYPKWLDIDCKTAREILMRAG